MLKDFKKFIMRGNVIDLAVAVVVGAAFNNVVQALVKDIITPLIAAIGGQPNFTNLSFKLHNSTFLYGDVINFVISFIVIAAVVFFLVVQPLNKLKERAARNKTPEEPTDKKCPYCFNTIPKQATRCGFCTSKLAGAKTE